MPEPHGEGRLVDWSISRSLARTIASGEDAPPLSPEEVTEVAGEALSLVLEHTGLEPQGPVPEAELVDREGWIDVNIGELQRLTAPLEARARADLRLPGPAGGLARRALGAIAGAEAGAIVGYASRRVMGQYVVSLAPQEGGPPRMLLVAPNLAAGAARIDADPRAFLRWVAIHEQTHSVQFAAVTWLRDHLADRVARIIDAASEGIDLGVLASRVRDLLGSDPRDLLRNVMQGELSRILAGPRQAALMDEIQAVMATIEGHAEHVMDVAIAEEPELADMRERMDERRRSGGLTDAIARALGLGMKLRQYELGKAWADAVAAERGTAGLNAAFASPESLPSLAELHRPAAWLDRVGETAPTSA